MPLPSLQDMIAADFGTVADLIGLRAREAPHHPALVMDERALSYGELDALMDRIGASLRRDGVAARDVIAVCATTSIEYAALFVGALRAGVAVAPIAPSSTPEQIAGMVADCGAKIFFLDKGVTEALTPVSSQITTARVRLDEGFEAWLAPRGSAAERVEIDPKSAFNIIYSSGTTGTPKGIVQSHAMRWRHLAPRPEGVGYGPEAVSLISTPLYSNTTLVCFFPTLAGGGTVVLMAKFDTVRFLELAQKHRVTHAMLVPVQYRRLMEHPDFDRYDLSAFQMKFATSAPFAAELKADVLKRWPGGLIEYYGMTEGGGAFILFAHLFPDKLHTVGQPSPGCDVKIIGEDGAELPPGEVGEVIGRGPATMNGYHNQPGKTAEAQWTDPATGLAYVRTGDVGRLDEDGFLTLMDRKKDMIISGGFNIYPSDLEAVIVAHPAVAEAAVVGVPSREWGETPVAFVALKAGEAVAAEDLRSWVNGQVGKTQRLADLKLVEALPRSHIGKVLKRELRDAYA